MNNSMLPLDKTTRGYFFFVGGIILLAYTLNILSSSFTLIIMIGALAMIAYGFNRTNLYEKCQQLVHEYRQKHRK